VFRYLPKSQLCGLCRLCARQTTERAELERQLADCKVYIDDLRRRQTDLLAPDTDAEIAVTGFLRQHMQPPSLDSIGQVEADHPVELFLKRELHGDYVRISLSDWLFLGAVAVNVSSTVTPATTLCYTCRVAAHQTEERHTHTHTKN
jgi:hypothetical protein